VNTQTGEVIQQESFQHRRRLRTLASPPFEDDIALRVSIVKP